MSRTRPARRLRHLLVGVLAAALAGVAAPVVGASPAVADTQPPVAGTPTTVSTDPLPTVQIDGVVWTQLVVGDTVYAGGTFTTARPAGADPGVDTVTRNNLLAYDIRTGELVTSFVPDLNGAVRALAVSADKSTLYVGGQFTQANGLNRYRLAAYNLSTGALSTTWKPQVDATVAALAVQQGKVYAGGSFSSANGTPRRKAAAFDGTSGATIATWDPSPDNRVTALVGTPDGSKVIMGGAYKNLGTTPAYGLAALDPTTAAVLPWAVTSRVRDAGDAASILDLSTDGTYVYGSGYTFGGGGNLEGTFSATQDGTLRWIEDCHGDTYSVFGNSGAVYVANHAHYCGNIYAFPETSPRTHHRALAFSRDANPTRTITKEPGSYANWQGTAMPDLLTWFPDLVAGAVTGQDQAAWTVRGTDEYVVMGGEFPKVGSTKQQGLVRFAVPTKAPNEVGPEVAGSDLTPQVSSNDPGTVRVAWTSDWDTDNEQLTYNVVRDGAVVATLTGRSTFWNRPPMGWTDSGLTPGSTHVYKVTVTDPWGNKVTSDTTTATVSSTGTAGVYSRGVLADGASDLWRLGEASGAVGNDAAGNKPLAIGSGVTRGTAGAVSDPDTATTFNAAATNVASTQVPMAAPLSFTVEAWFRTNALTGGKIIGYGGSSTGLSGGAANDRHVYMSNNGRLNFGVNASGKQVITSPLAYNDNKWHLATASLGADGMKLYVDGSQVAVNATVTTANALQGYWRVGGDQLSGWANAPSSYWFRGAIDEVAVYDKVLAPSAVLRHFKLASGPLPNVLPTASFTTSSTGSSASVDGTASSDTDGTISSYAWQWGDGATSTGATSSHAYAAGGTYTVTLTVTDNSGGTASTTRSVTVANPPVNQKPVASASVSATDLAVTADGSASSDPDGTVAFYAWDFGDGGTGSGATATHTYAAAGTYTVTLVVTDDRGATDTTTRSVTVTAPVVTVYGSDDFGRTTTTGFGTADVGGTWTIGGGAANVSVTDGAGRFKLAAAGSQLASYLNGVSATAVDASVDVSYDKPMTGGGAYLSLIGRRVGTTDYRARAKFTADGKVTLTTVRVSGGETTLQSVVLPGLTMAPGDVLHLRTQVTGTSPTTVRARAWKGSDPEPSTWTLSTTDAAPELQVAGAVGLLAYVSGSATNAPLTMSVDAFRAVPVAP
ncbi:PKD domain-containing protein [Angustibacter aerolatus]